MLVFILFDLVMDIRTSNIDTNTLEFAVIYFSLFIAVTMSHFVSLQPQERLGWVPAGGGSAFAMTKRL